jgi:hypothetical protein
LSDDMKWTSEITSKDPREKIHEFQLRYNEICWSQSRLFTEWNKIKTAQHEAINDQLVNIEKLIKGMYPPPSEDSVSFEKIVIGYSSESDVMKAITELGDRVYYYDKLNEYVLWIIRRDHPTVLELLMNLEYFNANGFEAQYRGTVLYQAINSKSTKVASYMILNHSKYLYNMGYIDSKGNTYLLRAYKQGLPKVASWIIDNFGEACLPHHVNDEGECASAFVKAIDIL